MFRSLEVCSEENASPCTSSLYSEWLLQACVVMLQHSLHVQCLSEASGRTAWPSSNGCLFWSPIPPMPVAPFGTDTLAAPQPPCHSAGLLKSVCGSLERLMSGLGTWWSGVNHGCSWKIFCSDIQLSQAVRLALPSVSQCAILHSCCHPRLPHSLLLSWQLTGLCSYGDAALPMGHSLTLEHCNLQGGR